VDGLEPSTSASQTRRATNCATPRCPAFIFAKQYNLYADDSQGLPVPGEKTLVINELVRIHHEKYLDDIKFWHSMTKFKVPVLELGCGQGRVMLPLWKDGVKIFGVDLDFDSLQYLSTASKEEGLSDPKLVQADMLYLPVMSKFGSVIIPCNTYSTLDAEERKLILSRIFQLLIPSGTFLASVPNPVLIQAYYQELSVDGGEIEPDVEETFPHPITGNPVQVSSHLYPLDGALSWEWIYDHLHPDGKVERHRQTAIHTISSFEQYKIELEDAGFQNNQYLGDFEGNLYGEDSPYLIMICSKS
jgi:SAM-dependent methyltransferase